jgi:raffinose/stachyose/melibiose transport system permease protein
MAPETSGRDVLRKYRRISRTTFAVLVVLLFLVPVLYVVMISLEPPDHFLNNPLVPPTRIDLGNFQQAWDQGDLGPELVDTLVYSVAAGAITTILSLFIAFPIARRLIRAASGVYTSFVLGLFLPIAVIPLFIESQKLSLYNNRIGYILLNVEPGMPLGVILLSAVVLSVPRELDEAALMDGCGYLRYLVSVVMPLTRSGMLVVFLYSLLNVWNNIIAPVVFLSNSSLYPITQGLYSFFGSHESEWTVLAAALIIVSLPVLVLFVVSQRRLLTATIAGAVKS